jgi:segregation and condensation protein A
MPYEISLEQFSGPLDKLLELIEAKKLDITQVSLAAVTVDFLEYIKTLEGRSRPDQLADFLVVAARLILIKSKSLLPNLALTETEEADIHDLESRLAIYRVFAARGGQASAHLNTFWRARRTMHARSFLTGVKPAALFYPPQGLSVDRLAEVMRAITATLIETVRVEEEEEIERAIFSIEEKMQELMERCKTAAAQSFKALSKEKPRLEVIALFLAMLHMFKDKLIHVEQEGQFGDIIVTSQPK